MGDFRADIKIEMTIFEKTYKMESWISYFPDTDGVDRRIKEFFATSFWDAKERYDEIIQNTTEREQESEIKAEELKELARLKGKYEKT